MTTCGGWFITKNAEGDGETGVPVFTRPVEPHWRATERALEGIKAIAGARLEKFEGADYGRWESATTIEDRHGVMGRLSLRLVRGALVGLAAARSADSALRGKADRFTGAEMDAAMKYGAGMIAAHFQNFEGAVHNCDPIVEDVLADSKFERAWELSLGPVRDIQVKCWELGGDPAALRASLMK